MLKTFKNIDNVLYRDAGADSELDYTEQTSWVLFYVIQIIQKMKKPTLLLWGKSYNYLMEEPYRWSSGLFKEDGSIDFNNARTEERSSISWITSFLSNQIQG